MNSTSEDTLNAELINAVARQDLDAVKRALRAGAEVSAHGYAVLSVAANSGDPVPNRRVVDPDRQAVLGRLLDEVLRPPRTAADVLAWARALDNDTIAVTLGRLPPVELA